MTSGRWLDRSFSAPSSLYAGLPFCKGEVLSALNFAVVVDGSDLHFYRLVCAAICTGVFEKAPGLSTKSIFAKWENRFFVLNANALQYYADESRNLLKGEFDISRSCLVSPTKNADNEIHIRVDAHDSQSRVFKMRSNDTQSIAEWKSKLESVMTFHDGV